MFPGAAPEIQQWLTLTLSRMMTLIMRKRRKHFYPPPVIFMQFTAERKPADMVMLTDAG